MPCPYIHTKLGNIKEEPLSDIIQRGFSVKKFREYSGKCLVGEDEEFARKYLNKDMTILNPIALNELFDEKDFEDVILDEEKKG